jgi:hypothetical protein
MKMLTSPKLGPGLFTHQVFGIQVTQRVPGIQVFGIQVFGVWAVW